MANECQGRWASTLVYLIKGGAVQNPPRVEQDGNIDIGAHTSNAFSGRHVNTNTDLDRGDCRRVTVSGQTRRRIRFTRQIPAESEVIDYEGFITDGQVIAGTFVHRGGGTDDGDTGTWGATKQVGLAPGKRPTASKKGGRRKSGRKGDKGSPLP
jgi:hypothetical protein